MNERYSRQILLDEVGESGQQKLLKSHVAIVGCGGLGTIAAGYLAGAGVGKMTLIDGDKPSLSNVHRQILYTGEENETKAAVLKNKLQALNPDIQINTHDTYLSKENINDSLTGVGLILECTDDIMCKYLVNDFAALDQIPLVYGAIYKYEGYVSTFLNRKETDLHLRDVFPHPDESLPTCAEVGVLNTIAGMIGMLQANEALKIILGIGEVLAGRLLTYDCLSNKQMILKMKKSWTQDLETYFEDSSYASLDCSFVPEIDIETFLKNREAYTLISVMSTEEHQAIDKASLHRPNILTDKDDLVPTTTPVVLYCKYGKTSKRMAAELLSSKKAQQLISLKGGYQAYQKFTASH